MYNSCTGTTHHICTTHVQHPRGSSLLGSSVHDWIYQRENWSELPFPPQEVFPTQGPNPLSHGSCVLYCGSQMR